MISGTPKMTATGRYCTQCGTTCKRVKRSKFICENEHESWLDPVPGAVVYVIDDEKVLYGVRSIGFNAGKLNIPGGFINLGETAEDAAERETKEELGVEIELMGLLSTYASGYEDEYVLNIVYVAKYVSGTPTGGDDMAGGEPRWISLDELPGKDELAWHWQLEAQTDLREWWKTRKR